MCAIWNIFNHQNNSCFIENLRIHCVDFLFNKVGFIYTSLLIGATPTKLMKTDMQKTQSCYPEDRPFTGSTEHVTFLDELVVTVLFLL